MDEKKFPLKLYLVLIRHFTIFSKREDAFELTDKFHFQNIFKHTTKNNG